MDNHGPALALVVPCFNEAARLRLADFDEALQTMPWLSFVFVDDGSTDETASILRDFCASHGDRAMLLSLPRNSGKGEAVRQGLLKSSGVSELCGFWDADLSAPLGAVASLRNVMTEHPDIDWVWGIRLRSLGRLVDRKASRHYLGRLFATVTSMALGLGAYDTQCGAKLFRSSPSLERLLASPFRSRWIFDVELLARGTVMRRHRGEPPVRVLELPLDEWHHRPGSALRLSDFFVAGLDLFYIRRACMTATESE